MRPDKTHEARHEQRGAYCANSEDTPESQCASQLHGLALPQGAFQTASLRQTRLLAAGAARQEARTSHGLQAHTVTRRPIRSGSAASGGATGSMNEGTGELV